MSVSEALVGRCRSPLCERLLKGRTQAVGIVRAWRRLTEGGAPTLVACSGGADSTALLLALRSATEELVVGHVVHDMRPVAEALADRDAVAQLAEALGLAFVEERIRAREVGGNVEAASRQLRRQALAKMAHAHGLRFVATAHQANDQLESLLMALVRGAGPAGLAGVAPTQLLDESVTLVRPMLRTTRADAEALCAAAGVRWREDPTNSDTTRLRAFLRHGPVRELLERAPHAAVRAARAATLCAQAHDVVRRRAEEVFASAQLAPGAWRRDALGAEPAIVVCEGIRRQIAALLAGRSLDRLTGAVLDPIARAIADDEPALRRFELPGGLELRVEGNSVALRRVDTTV